MRRLALALSSAILAATPAGCGPASYPGPAQLVLGGGVYQFLQEPACAPVGIVHGIQGGYHIWTSLRARYVDFSGVLVDVRYYDAASGALIHQVPSGEVDFDTVPADRLTAGDVPRGTPASCPDGGAGGDVPPNLVPGGTDGWGEALGLTGFLPSLWNGCMINACFSGQAIKQSVTITDSDGRTASDERTLLPSLSANDVSVYCIGDRDAGIVPVDLGGTRCY